MTLNLNSNQMTLREVEEAPIKEEVLDMVVVVDVREDQDSKMTEDLSIKLKVIKILNHLPLSLIILNPKILLHFLILVCHNHLNILRTSQIILKMNKVSYIILRDS